MITSYNEFEKMLMSKFSSNLPSNIEGSLKQELLGAYKVYLAKRYESAFSKYDEKTINNNLLPSWIASEEKEVFVKPLKQIINTLLPDPALDAIKNYSFTIYNIAYKKWDNGNLTADEITMAEQNFASLIKQFANLREEIPIALTMHSDAIVDVNYIKGTSEHISLRLANMTRGKKPKQ